ncbi:MAG: S9 family peptidase [Myxococcales bacterium]|nr:S9 family peptidase [Myxococcales bacterium]
MTYAKTLLPRLIGAVLSATLASCGSPEAPKKAPHLLAPNSQVVPKDDAAQSFSYPQTRREEVVDTYHGTEVIDAYRWLEDADSAETAAWVAAENKVTFAYLETIPERKTLVERLTKLWDYEKFGTPRKKGERYFYSRNDGLQNQSVVYWANALKDEPKVLLDPNTLSKDGTVALGSYSISDDGKYMAYGLQAAGSDWATWRVREVATGKDLGERLEWIKFSGASWDKQSTGFYYGRFPKPAEGAGLTEANFDQKVYFHKVGTPQEEDRMVFETKDNPKWSSDVEVSEDGRYLVASVTKGTGPMNQVHVRDSKAKGRKAGFRPIVSVFEAEYSFLGNKGYTFYFQTDNGAPRGRIISLDVRKPGQESWKEIVSQSDATLRSTNLVGGKLVTTYLRDAKSEIVIRNLAGKELKHVELPGIGSAAGFGGSSQQMETFYSFSGFTSPLAIYRYDFGTGKSTLLKEPKVDFDASQFETKQVFYTSKDGTRVPMFIVHKKGLELDGTNPTMLYGYGGFSISLAPRFSVQRIAWLEMGGVLAIPNLRGGGEYGEEWHVAGTKLQKQNVFDDFIAAAEWLIAQNYTSSPKLAISGRSNGGLLVGAVMTQRPELFGAALPGVGVLDMLRFHKFTIGWAWIDDYGSSEDPAEFEALRAYSPYHNLKEVAYPATLITTADHDDRVVPAHSFKFAAELQRVHTGETPVMIRIETKSGHGAGKPTSKRILDAADNYAFLVKVLGMK